METTGRRHTRRTPFRENCNPQSPWRWAGHVVGQCTRVLLIAFAILIPAYCAAQEVQVARTRGPYYVGEPVMVQIQARGYQPGDQVTCRLQSDPPPGITVQGPQVGQSSQSYTQIINGRMTSSESVDYRFSFQITADREGEFSVGPFEVTAGGKSQTIEATSFQFATLQDDPDMHIDLSLARDSVYVGEEIPVTVRWSFAGENRELQYAYSNLQIRSPLFDQFTFKDMPRNRRTSLTIATAKGGLEIDAEVTQEPQNGKTFVVVTGQLVLVADSPGEFQNIPITCRTKRVTSWGRDLFGDLVAGNAVPALSAGKPLSFQVKPIPEADRPASYSGAVGKTFSLEAAANRSEVRVGDPISLTLTVRGEGNVEKVSLPSLSSPDALPADQFQVAADQLAGKFDGQSKQFKVSIRVKDRTVTRIPALSFSWFDPEQEKFLSTQSSPIALQVMEAQVVSAADVVSAVLRSANGNDSSAASGNSGDSRHSNTPIGAMVSANLAIERDAARLLTTTPHWASPRTISIALYVASALAILVGIIRRRAGQVEPIVVQRRQRLKVLHGDVAKAVDLPPREAADLIARALREVIAQYHLPHRDAAESIIAQSERVIFSTGPNERTGIDELIRQALQQIDEAKESL